MYPHSPAEDARPPPAGRIAPAAPRGGDTAGKRGPGRPGPAPPPLSPPPPGKATRDGEGVAAAPGRERGGSAGAAGTRAPHLDFRGGPPVPSRAATEQLRGGAGDGGDRGGEEGGAAAPLPPAAPLLGECGGVPAPRRPARWQEAAGSPGEEAARISTAPTHSPPLPWGFPWRGKSGLLSPRVCPHRSKGGGRAGAGGTSCGGLPPSPLSRRAGPSSGRGVLAAAASLHSPHPLSPPPEVRTPRSCPLCPQLRRRLPGPQPRVPVPSPGEQRAAAPCGLLGFIQASGAGMPGCLLLPVLRFSRTSRGRLVGRHRSILTLEFNSVFVKRSLGRCQVFFPKSIS